MLMESARDGTRTCTTFKGQGIFLPTTTFVAPDFVRICGLDFLFAIFLYPEMLGAACQVSTPLLRNIRENLARDCHVKGFPEFKRFYIRNFFRCTQIKLSPSCLPFHHPGVVLQRYMPAANKKAFPNDRKGFERKTRLELATLGLGSQCSTTELFPQKNLIQTPQK